MSSLSLATQGMELVEAKKDYPEAIKLLSKAIDQSKSPQWLLSRSKAYMESGDLDKALRDAEYAYCTAVERGNDKSRKQMIEAQHRRSVIYYRQNLYANADVCATWAQELAKGTAVKIADHSNHLVDDNGFYHATQSDIDPDHDIKGKGKEEKKPSDAGTFAKISSLMGGADAKKHPYEKEYQREKFWRQNIITFLEKLPSDHPARKITVKLTPVKPTLDDTNAKKPQKHDPELEAAKVAARAPSKPQPSNGPFRSDFYQNDTSCTVTLFMKFAHKDDVEKVHVDIQPNLITITGVPREPSTAYIVPHAAINPASSSFRVVSMKIELNLAKAHPSKWPSFGHESLTKPDSSSSTEASANTTTAADSALSVVNNSAKTRTTTTDKPPAYPTSSKSGPKDWERLGVEDDDEAKNVDDFFKKLYADAPPDQKRAMMKSYRESNGTTLSTNWDEVSKGPVETNPPEGMEAKPWHK